MKNLSMRLKFLFFALVPMLTATILTVGIIIYIEQKSLIKEVESFENTLVTERKSNIQDATRIATAVAEDIVNRLGVGEDGKRALKQAFSKAYFSQNNAGYFFIFDDQGEFVVHSLNPQVEGTPGINLTDPNGVKITIALREKARSGGGFVEYVYDKPGHNTPQPKISYASPIANSNGLFINTGLYIDDIDREVAQFKLVTEAQMVEQIKTIIYLGVLLIVVVVIVMTFVSNSITKPICNMLHRFNDIASGNGDLTYRINAKGKDEIAQLGNAFDQFIEKLHTIISNVAEATSHVTKSASSIHSQTDKLQKQLEDHNIETEMVVTSVTEMGATAQDVAKNTVDVSDATNNVNKETIEALNVVDISTRSIAGLEGNIQQSSENMDELKSQTKMIDGVLEVIGDIADQTNLLALNAAIEAARAGEQGRGFAVVADEVRGLASRTQGSTHEIKQMLEALHTYVQQAALSMANSKESCETVVSSSKEITEGLNSVNKAVEAINLMTDQIATSTTEQSTVTEQISEKLVVIRSIVTSLLESSHNSNLVANELSDAGGRLNELVSQFKL